MITQRPCVNGILAAVLSASILPMHGALAKEAKPASTKPVEKHAMKKTPGAKATKPAAATPSPDMGAPSDGSGKAQ